MFENPRRGRRARNFTTNVPKIIDLKSSSEQLFSENYRWVPLCRAENYNNQTLLAWSTFTFFHLLSKGIPFKNERVNKITLYKHFVEQNL